MKNNFIRVLKMAAFYSILGLLLQGLLVNILIASMPAEGQNLRDIKVTINVQNVSLQDALTYLEKNTNFKFVYLKEEIPLNEKVTVIVTDESLYNILEVFAQDYGLLFNRINNQITIKKAEGWEKEKITSAPDPGTITGTVKDERTKSGIPGANVFIKGLSIGAAADENGIYTIKNVPPGKYDVQISAVGFSKILINIVVESGKTTLADFELSSQAIGLDEVVVTGVAFGTNKKTVPSAITVLTAAEVETKNSKNILELLDGEIPGVTVRSVGVRDFGSIVSRNNAKLETASPDVMKIYIDGIEVADPLLLHTLDPSIIDRIEVVSGGAASTIYGSGSVGGVIQVFTKKGLPGRTTPKVELRSSVGYIESKWLPENATPLKQDNTLTVSGGGNDFSYRLGGTYNSVGEWVKNYSSKTYSLNGGMSTVLGPFSAEITGMYSERPITSASQASYLFYQWPKSALLPYGGQKDLIYPNIKYNYKQTLLGINLSYQIQKDWIASLTLGVDKNEWSSYQVTPYFLNASDTLLSMQGWGNNKTSAKFISGYSTNLTDGISARFTVGIDWWGNSFQSVNASNMKKVIGRVQATTRSSYSVGNDYYWNLGYFGLAEIGFFNQVFLTLANRFEESPRYGSNISRVSAPRVGLSFTTNLFPDVTLKLRGQWGEGTRLPSIVHREGSVSIGSTSTTIYLPNQDIRPEKKTGWDAGFELYFGNYASFSATRFSEDGIDLIMPNYLQVGPPTFIYQYQNVGNVETRGWEFLATFRWEWLSLRMNYTYSKGTVVSLGTDYARSTNALYKEGDQLLFFPVHSGGGTISARYLKGSANLNFSYTAQSRSLDIYRYYQTLFGGAPPLPGTGSRAYLMNLPTMWTINFQTDQQLNDWLNISFQVKNILNDHETGLNRGVDIAMGRTWIIGFKLSN